MLFLSPSFFLKYLFICLAVLGLSCGMQALVSWPGMEPGPSAGEARSLNHRTTGEIPQFFQWVLTGHFADHPPCSLSWRPLICQCPYSRLPSRRQMKKTDVQMLWELLKVTVINTHPKRRVRLWAMGFTIQTDVQNTTVSFLGEKTHSQVFGPGMHSGVGWGVEDTILDT